MHKILRDALPQARGYSDQVIVVIADIRGFSEFCLSQESPDVAMYIRRVYLRLIDDYFPFASFYKPTGDGLLLTINFDEDSLAEMARKTMAACLRCLREFPAICKGDPVINFDVPAHMGFGVTRGTACRLVSGELVLDYSGRILNLASRLTDLARPRGVVIDGAFGVELLEPRQRKKFVRCEVYIRSVAEDMPRTVYTLNSVEIPEHAKRPLSLEEWETVEWSQTVAEWKKMVPTFALPLPKEPKRPDGIEVRTDHDAFTGRRLVPGMSEYKELTGFRLIRLENNPLIEIDVGEMLAGLKTGLPQKTEVTVKVSYVPR